MATSRTTLNSPDWQDATRAALCFAADWQGSVRIVLSPYGSENRPGLTVTAHLYADQTAAMGAKPLASASVSIDGGGAGALSAGVLSALYELDKVIYRREIGISPPRR